MSNRDEIAALARQFVIESNQKTSSYGPDGFTDAQRTGGALLDAVLDEIRSVLVAHADRAPLVLFDAGPERWTVDGQGMLVRTTPAEAARPRQAAELVRIEPDVRAILNRLDVYLIDLNDPAATAAAMLLRDVRGELEAALAGPPSRGIGGK